MPHLSDDAARKALRQFVRLNISNIRHLGNHGGFSGAQIWKLQTTEGSYCLHAWPVGDMEPARLGWIHRLLHEAVHAGLDFIPRPLGNPVVVDQRCWELQTWLPGNADFSRDPSAPRMGAAATALARLHVAWATTDVRYGPCPAVARRLDACARWLQLREAGWRPTPQPDDPVRPLVERIWPLLCEQVPRLPAELLPWSDVTLSLQPCLCDPWHDHVLFEGDRVSGLIDFGSVKIDHVAVDLARMLGSLAARNEPLWNTGLDAYRRVRVLAPREEELTRLLDRTGTLLGAANWLRWLFHENRTYEDRETVARRLEELVRRLD